MIQILKAISLRYAAGASDKVYHLQLIERSNGFQCVAQYGRFGGHLSPSEKTSAGVRFALADHVFFEWQRKKSAEYTEILLEIPPDVAPYRDEPHTLVADPAEIERIVANHAQAPIFDDAEHAQRIADRHVRETVKRANDVAAEAAHQKALLAHRARKEQQRLIAIAERIQINAREAFPFIPTHMPLVRIKKHGAQIELGDSCPPEERERLTRLLRAIGGSVAMNVLLVAGRICVLESSVTIPTIQSEILLTPKDVFTNERRRAILRYALEHASDPDPLFFYDPSCHTTLEIAASDLRDTAPLLTDLLTETHDD